MTRGLAGAFAESDMDEPIGALAGSWLSIINVSELPFDSAAYQQLIAKGEVALDETQRPSLEQWLKLMYSFQLLKRGPADARREDFANDVERHVNDDFRCRATSAVGCETQLIVFLGSAAKDYYEKLCPECGAPNAYAPHPSRKSGNSNVWRVDDQLRREIQRIVRASR